MAPWPLVVHIADDEEENELEDDDDDEGEGWRGLLHGVQVEVADGEAEQGDEGEANSGELLEHGAVLHVEHHHEPGR